MGTPSSSHAVFGPVSSITTAPVSMGNSVCGSAPVVHQVQGGVRVMGRDFMFPVASVNNVKTDWVMVGGCPLIPHSFVASVMRSYASIYAEFIVHGMTFHFVTAMPTNAVGDVMFYVNKDRGAALLDTTNTNFMSVVLSDPNTVLGPLWHNHSATYKPVFTTYPTSIFNDESLRSQGPGELFLYMKTSQSSTLGSPGYVLVDFDISFKTLQTNPRELTFPLTRLKYNQYGLNTPVGNPAAGAPVIVLGNGNKIDGFPTSGGLYSDTAAQQGDIYKVVMMPDYGTYINLTSSNFLAAQNGITQTTSLLTLVNIDDGFTCFGVLIGGPGDAGLAAMVLYPSFQAAKSQSRVLVYATNFTAAAFNIPSWLSLVGSVDSALFQANY